MAAIPTFSKAEFNEPGMAHPIRLSVEGANLDEDFAIDLDPKDWGHGKSIGWHGQEQFLVNINGKQAKARIEVNVFISGSKGLVE